MPDKQTKIVIPNKELETKIPVGATADITIDNTVDVLLFCINQPENLQQGFTPKEMVENSDLYTYLEKHRDDSEVEVTVSQYNKLKKKFESSRGWGGINTGIVELAKFFKAN